jgi:hypothetical protein
LLPIPALQRLDHPLGDKRKERGTLQFKMPVVDHPVVHAGQNEAFLGASHTHIKESLLLLVVSVPEKGARNEPILASRDEYHRPLQSLGGVKRHESNAIAQEGAMVNATVQGEGIKERSGSQLEMDLSFVEKMARFVLKVPLVAQFHPIEEIGSVHRL